jgi:hypothetical protein
MRNWYADRTMPRPHEEPSAPLVYEYEHWNAPEILPPVACPIVIRVGAAVFHCERTSHITDKSREMVYRLLDGSLHTGRHEWTFP